MFASRSATPAASYYELRKETIMSRALYAMNYVGQTGTGGGAVYVGDGKIVGVDVGNLRYHGSYTEQSGRLKGTVALTAPTGGTLVIGAQLPSGSQIALTIDWPAHFDDGKPQPIMIEGRPVHVIFEKVGDI
jgi:hypothetical protein